MRVSLALSELKISFELLQEYGKLLEVDITPAYSISEELLSQIKDLHSHEPTRSKLINITVDKVAKKLGAYREGDNLKMLAKIKWFGDESKNGDYGFLEVPGFDDVFFHFKQVEDIPRSSLRPDKTVIILISQTNLFAEKKKSVSSVQSLESETDIPFILQCISNERAFRVNQFRIGEVFHQFIQNLNSYSESLTNNDREEFVNSVIKHLKEKTFSINLEEYFSRLLSLFYKSAFKSIHAARLAEVSEAYILEAIYSLKEWSFILNFREFCGIPRNAELEQFITEITPTTDKLFWWTEHNFKITINEVIDELAVKLISLPFKQDELLKIISLEEMKRAFSLAYEKIVNDKESQYSLNIIGDFLKFSFQNNQIPDLNLLGDDKLFDLWNKGYIESFPLSAVRNHLKILSEDKNIQGYGYNKIEGNNKIKPLLAKLSTQQLRDIVSAICFNGDEIKTSGQFHEFSQIIKSLGIEEAKEKGLIELAYTKSTDYYKLLFFISDFTDELDYDGALIYTGLLPATQQKLFFKKVIKLIEEEKVQLTLEDLSRITTIDYETSEYAKEIDGVGLDFSLSIVLRLLNDLKSEKITNAETIYDIVAKQIKRPDDLLVIDGFFEKCPGRMILKKDTEPGIHLFERKWERKPRFATFCDGRKPIDKSTGTASKCQQTGKEFWWCENSKCYENARIVNTGKDWKHYNLEDILKVLDINYSLTQYEILVGLINRVNRFLEHLTCRTCKKILKPSNKGNYGFYRVSNFQCPDLECKDHNEVIYLSHCANGACEDIIDSRDSVKCKPEGHHQNCGWYICNNCMACCSTQKLNGRIYVSQMTGQEYKCHSEGHKDRGIICCNKCGNEMENHEQHGSQYKKQLDWFIDQRNTNRNIKNSGIRKDGKYWFIWAQGTFTSEEYRKQLLGLYKNGFNIPDFNDFSNTAQLIAEPFQEHKKSLVFSCKACSYIFKFDDLAEFDYARQNSIKKYHDMLFDKYAVK